MLNYKSHILYNHCLIITMKKTIDKTVALKLINQYADNYKRLEEENVWLKKEIKDLKSNLIVNKSVIDTLVNENDTDVKIQLLIEKYKAEIAIINSKSDLVKKDNSNLRTKLLKYEASISDSIKYYKNCKETLELKVFTLENAVKKRDSQLKSLNKKLKHSIDHKLKSAHKETSNIYVCDPNRSLSLMYSDLLLYKEGYENALMKIKEKKLEIDSLQKKLQHKESNKTESDQRKITVEMLNEMIAKCQRKSYETDEWLSILSYLNITKKDIDNNIPNTKFFNKIFEAIELLNKIIIERNHQLTRAVKNNEELKEMNKAARNENMRLLKHIIALKNQKGISIQPSDNDNSDRISNHYINSNISMINNFNLDDNSKNGIMQKIEMKTSDGLISSVYNKTFTLENSIMDRSYTKNYNYTQVTENSFDIVEPSNLISLIQKKQFEKWKHNDNVINREIKNNNNINDNAQKHNLS